MTDSFEFSYKIDTFVDRFEELKFFTVFAGKLIDSITGNDNYQCPFDWVGYENNSLWGPEQFATKELLPFLRTIQARLPELHKLLSDTLERCHDGCAFSGEDKDTEPKPEPAVMSDADVKQRLEMITDMFAVQKYSENGDENLRQMAKLGRILRKEPEKFLAFLDGQEDPKPVNDAA